MRLPWRSCDFGLPPLQWLADVVPEGLATIGTQSRAGSGCLRTVCPRAHPEDREAGNTASAILQWFFQPPGPGCAKEFWLFEFLRGSKSLSLRPCRVSGAWRA